MLGENVAMDMRVDDAHDNLMQSAPHRSNILDRRFNAVGIGVATDGSGIYYMTQDFLHTSRIVTSKAPAPSTPRATPAPRPPAAPKAPRPPRAASAPKPPTSTSSTALPVPGPVEIVITRAEPTEPEPPSTLDTADAGSDRRTGSNVAGVAGLIALFAVGAATTRPLPGRRGVS